jgi:uracil-DNA glycosylase
MENQKLLKLYLEMCRRLGVRYISLAPERIAHPAQRPAPVRPSAAVMRASDAKSEMSAKSAPFPKPEKPLGGPPSKPFERASDIQGRPDDGTQGRPHWMTSNEESIQAMELVAFQKDICECQKCPLGKTRKNFVFGSGNPQAKVVFVGEAPGGEEDAQGLPFVGAAGQLLTKIIESTKVWKRSDVFICNVLKCRPPNNNTPSPEEVEKCLPYLEEQIQIIKPKLIMAMGASAARALLRTTDSVGKLRGRWHDFNGIPLRVTYHPAALLRYEGYKRDVWEDMKELTKRYSEEI